MLQSVLEYFSLDNSKVAEKKLGSKIRPLELSLSARLITAFCSSLQHFKSLTSDMLTLKNVANFAFLSLKGKID